MISKLYSETARPKTDTGTLDDITEIVLVAAVQLHTTGRIQPELLQSPQLANIMQRPDPMLFFDEIIDTIYATEQQDKIWAEMEKKYSPTLVNLAKGIEQNGLVQHSLIFGDAFPDKINLPEFQKKFALMRAGKLDDNDPDYRDLMVRVDNLRMHRREQRRRDAFFGRLDAAIGAVELLQREQEQAVAQKQETKRKLQASAAAYIETQVKAFAQMAARADAALHDMFVEGPDADRNKDAAVKGLTIAAGGLSLMFSPVSEEAPQPAAKAEVVVPVAPALPAEKAIEITQTATTGQCSKDFPMLVDGKTYNFLLDDPKLCAELMKIVPAKGQTTQLNNVMSLKANDNGTFYFRIAAKQTHAECLKNAPVKTRTAFLMRGWAEGAKSVAEICQKTVVSDNEISSRNMNAMVEAWLYSGGKAGKPINFTYFLSKWFLESRHGNLKGNPTTSAYGINQFVLLTWVDQILLHGNRLGAPEARARLVAIANGMGISEAQLQSNAKYVRRLSKSPAVRAMHKQYTIDPFHSAVFGSEYSLAGLLRLQDAFISGDIKHPWGQGHTEVTSKMGYTCHLLGFGGCRKFFAAYAKNPHQKVRDVIKGGPYKRNAYLFEMKVPVRDRDGKPVINPRTRKPFTQHIVNMTLKEFTDYLEIFGFDDKPMPGLESYKRLGVSDLAKNQNIGPLTLLTEEETKGYSFSASTTAKTAIAKDSHPRWVRPVLPVQANKIEAPMVHAVRPAQTAPVR